MFLILYELVFPIKMIYEFKFGLETGHCVPKSGCHLKLFFLWIFQQRTGVLHKSRQHRNTWCVWFVSDSDFFFLFDCRSDIKEPSPQREQHTAFKVYKSHCTLHKDNSQERWWDFSGSVIPLCFFVISSRVLYIQSDTWSELKLWRSA